MQATDPFQEIRILKSQRDALAEALKRFVSLCPSSEGLGGHAPMGAFSIAAECARTALTKLEDQPS